MRYNPNSDHHKAILKSNILRYGEGEGWKRTMREIGDIGNIFAYNEMFPDRIRSAEKRRKKLKQKTCQTGTQ